MREWSKYGAKGRETGLPLRHLTGILINRNICTSRAADGRSAYDSIAVFLRIFSANYTLCVFLHTHQTITKTVISKESGVSKKTLTKPYVYEYLMRYPEFAGTEIEKSGTSEEMAARIKMLEEQLKISVQRNKKLTEELKKVKAENDIKYKQLRLDYERIAGAYQKLSEKKLVRL